MDPFSQYEMYGEMLWLEPVEIRTIHLPVRQSAFHRYTRPLEHWDSGGSRSNGNLHKRMIETLRTIRMANADNRDDAESSLSRGHRHMINERQRRQKMRQNYAILHSLLPPRTKADKNTIVQMAALHLHELQGLKDKLQMRSSELEERVGREDEVSKINIRVRNPSSSMDSMVGVLRCLKSMKLKARKVRSKFSPDEFCAILDIETKIPTTEVEKAVEEALMEVERNFVISFPE